MSGDIGHQSPDPIQNTAGVIQPPEDFAGGALALIEMFPLLYHACCTLNLRLFTDDTGPAQPKHFPDIHTNRSNVPRANLPNNNGAYCIIHPFACKDFPGAALQAAFAYILFVMDL